MRASFATSLALTLLLALALLSACEAVRADDVFISDSAVPDGQVGVAYGVTFVASFGVAPYSFAMSGVLPDGLILTSDGVLSGTPASGGDYSFTIFATDSDDMNGPFTESQDYVLTVLAPSIIIVPATLPDAIVGAAYSLGIGTQGGTPPFAFDFQGVLPPGIALSSDGVLSGAPTADGAFSFTVSATDSSGGSGPYTASQNYVLTVDIPKIIISPSNLPDAQLRTGYTLSLGVIDGTPPFFFNLQSGALPDGLGLSPDGVLTGTPSALGSFAFSIFVTDSSGGSGPFSASQSYTLSVDTVNITILPPALPAAQIAQGYSLSLNGTGGSAPYSFSILNGVLPKGLALSSQGVISGIPVAGGTFNFTAAATDSSGGPGPYTSAQQYALTVSPPIISVTPAALPNAAIETGYAQTISAAGGTAPYTFSTGGPLPRGLNLTPDGMLAGTPSVLGVFKFVIAATDSSIGTGPFTATQAYTLTITPPVFVIFPAIPPPAYLGNAYLEVFEATGGTAPYSYLATSLPANFTLSSNGNLSGISGTPGTFAFTMTVTDSSRLGPFSIIFNYSLVVEPPPPPEITSPLTAQATVGQPFSFTVTAMGPGSISFQAAPLPAGLSFAGDTISGIPTVAGAIDITLSATSPSGTATHNLRLTIANPSASSDAGPHFTSEPFASPNPGLAGQAITLSALAVDTDNDLVAFSWDFGDGTTGFGATPSHIYSAPGIYTATVTATDGVSSVAASINVAVNAGVLSDLNGFTIQKLQLKLNLVKSGKDSLMIQGLIPVQAGFMPSGQSLGVEIGALQILSTLDKRGVSNDKKFKIAGKQTKGGSFISSPAKFALTLRNTDLVSNLGVLGLGTASNPSAHFDMAVSLGSENIFASTNLNYVVTSNKKGVLAGTAKK